LRERHFLNVFGFALLTFFSAGEGGLFDPGTATKYAPTLAKQFETVYSAKLYGLAIRDLSTRLPSHFLSHLGKNALALLDLYLLPLPIRKYVQRSRSNLTWLLVLCDNRFSLYGEFGASAVAICALR
jgi:hypothetical protein